jgi:hypothetical protein
MSMQWKLRTVLFCALMGAAAALPAQNPAPAPVPDSTYPEQGYLSPTHYVNEYFGFGFELPAEARLHATSQPASRDGSIPLLNLTGPPPADAQLILTAIPTASGKPDDARTLMRQALDQDLYIGVEELRALSKTSIAGHQFYVFETRRGIEQHMLAATSLGDYILKVVLASHDEKVVKRLEQAFQHMVFFPSASAREHLDADAKAYEGPSVSSHRLALLESDPPAKHIDPGKVMGDFYENSMLGFSYRIPQGWVLRSESAVQPAIERHRQRMDFGQPRMGRVERTLFEACNRTLFSAWSKRPDNEGEMSYEDFGEVTISAMAASCFPNLHFPDNIDDREAFKSFLGQYALTHPMVNDMRDAKVFTEDGLTFLFLDGTVAFNVPGDDLSRRLSLGMAITQHRGYVLTWFFAAPHEQELRALTNERASFDRAPAVAADNAPKPGGGVAETSAAATPAATPPAAAQAGGAAADSDQPASTQSQHPSLLRPGETMDSQQGKGAVIKKK